VVKKETRVVCAERDKSGACRVVREWCMQREESGECREIGGGDSWLNLTSFIWERGWLQF